MKSNARFYVGDECIGSYYKDPLMSEGEFEDECYGDAVWMHRTEKQTVIVKFDDGTVWSV